jgi:hypothetical protein
LGRRDGLADAIEKAKRTPETVATVLITSFIRLLLWIMVAEDNIFSISRGMRW